MVETKYSRKLDSVGRILIPAALRKELGLKENVELKFYTHEDQGRRYLCMECPVTQEQIEWAKHLLELAEG